MRWMLKETELMIWKIVWSLLAVLIFDFQDDGQILLD